MFQNSYQGGSFFELFDAKSIKEKERPIFKVLNPNAMTRVFDRELKSYFVELEGNNRMTFPREQKQDLYLLQQYIVIQLCIQSNAGFGLQLIVSDSSRTKRRIVFSHTTSKTEKKPFFVKLGSQRFRKGKWLNLCIDVWSFIAAFKGQAYRSLDQISVSGGCRIRKIYTTKSPLLDMDGEDDSSCQKSQSFLPKHFSLPPGIPFTNQTFTYADYCPDQCDPNEADSQFKQTQTDLSSNISNVMSNIRMKDTRRDFSTPKVQPLKSSSKFNNDTAQRKFLANTNSTEMIMRNHRQQQRKLQKKLVGKSVNKTTQPVKGQPQSSKQTVNKTNLTSTTKTQLARPGIDQTSLEKKTTANSKSPKKRREKLEATKINPWRASQPAIRDKLKEQEVKQEIQVDDERDIKSAHTTVFKKKNKLTLEKKITNPIYTNQKIQNTYSDSEYFELSQKFSTITDPKVFRPELIQRMSENMHNAGYNNHNNNTNNRRDEDEQIEQAIEGELNSVQDCKSERNQQPQFVDKRSSVHNESMRELQQNDNQEGFMQQHLRRMMGELQRPYTPPIHAKEQKKVQSRPCIQNNSTLEVIYDPVLNCYYDFKTNTYYELKA